jgi:hypothetical protein
MARILVEFPASVSGKLRDIRFGENFAAISLTIVAAVNRCLAGVTAGENIKLRGKRGVSRETLGTRRRNVFQAEYSFAIRCHCRGMRICSRE